MIDSAAEPGNDVSSGVRDLAENTPSVKIDSAAALRDASRGWLRSKVLAIDTEFVRERTFYPRLGLIQICDGQRVYLVDPLPVETLDTLGGVLLAPSVLKVLHSGSEDLEVLYHLFGDFPQPLFDTQVAATVLGIGYSVGYGKLVKVLFGLDIEKAQTRTNWLQRPLTEDQERYAAQDVVYLIPAYRRLAAALESRNRRAWAKEEMDRLYDAERFLPDPESYYLRLKQARSASRRELAALKALGSWREREARRRDLPRNFIVSEAALGRLAKRRPKTRRELARIRELASRDRARYGDTFLSLLRDVAAKEPDALPPMLRQSLNLAPYKGVIDELRQTVASRADELGIAPEFLTTRKVVTTLVRRVLSAESPLLPEELRGWRRKAIGNLLVDQLERRLRDGSS